MIKILAETDRQRIHNWFENYCYNAKIDSTVYDIEAKIDGNLLFDENLNIIEADLEILSERGELMERQAKSILQRQKEEAALNAKSQAPKIKALFDKPKIIGLCSDVNSGKSMAIYYLLTELRKSYNFRLYSYGLRKGIGQQSIHSIEELEQVRNSIIAIDEFFSLFDLEDRKKRQMIEKTLRLLHHRNNIIILSGVPENFKKFISAKLDIIIYKKTTIADMINGSRLKHVALSYKGMELGSSILDIDINKALAWDGKHYSEMAIPYLEEFDTKKENPDIFSELKCAENVQKTFKEYPIKGEMQQEKEQDIQKPITNPQTDSGLAKAKVI